MSNHSKVVNRILFFEKFKMRATIFTKRATNVIAMESLPGPRQLPPNYATVCCPFQFVCSEPSDHESMMSFHSKMLFARVHKQKAICCISLIARRAYRRCQSAQQNRTSLQKRTADSIVVEDVCGQPCLLVIILIIVVSCGPRTLVC